MALADILREKVPKRVRGNPSLYAKRETYHNSAQAEELEIRLKPFRGGFCEVTVIAEYSPRSSLVEAAEVERLGKDFSSDPDSVRFLVYQRSEDVAFDFDICGNKFSVTGSPGMESRNFYCQRHILKPVLDQLGVRYHVKEPHLYLVKKPLLQINRSQKEMNLSPEKAAKVYDLLVRKGYVPSLSISKVNSNGLSWALFQHPSKKRFGRGLYLSHAKVEKPLSSSEMEKFDKALMRNGVDLARYSFVFDSQKLPSHEDVANWD